MHAKIYQKTNEPCYREEVTLKSPSHSPAASAVAGGTLTPLCFQPMKLYPEVCASMDGRCDGCAFFDAAPF